jgi:predicted RND superfamily exporter protein
VTAPARQHRVLAPALVALATAGALAVAWQGRERLAGAVQVLPPDAPEIRLDREMEAQFGVQNPVVWVIVARQGSVWSEAVLGQVHALTREVFRIPGVIATDVIGLASPNMRDFVVTEEIMEPVYLMGRVPETAEEMERLRRRVEGNPNYHGTLVSLGGRAAMIVADFRPDADPAVVAGAALALRDKYRGEATDVYVAGGPVLIAVARQHRGPLVAGVALIGLAGALAAAFALGVQLALASALAPLLAGLWSIAVLVALDAVVWPWTGYGILTAMFLAPAMLPSDGRFHLALALLAGFAAVWLLAAPPARAFAVAVGAGTIAALAAAQLLNLSQRRSIRITMPFSRPPHPNPRPASIAGRGMFAGAVALLIAAALGLVHLRMAFGLFGYGTRYLPTAAAADLRAIGEHFPPPTALAVRLRGKPGFVHSPGVLESLDALTAAVRDDLAVVRALSLADLVKIVNRAFHEDQPEFEVLPAEPGMAARYLALAYSPGFRRFVDRAFSQSAVWVYLRSDDPADLARVRAKLETQIETAPIPGVEIDRFGGDGAIAWRTAEVARAFGLAVLAGLLVSALGLAMTGGLRLGAVTVIGGASAAILLGGWMGWTGVPIDLVSLPLLVSAAFGGCVFAALPAVRPLAWTLAFPAVTALTIAALSANLLAALAGGFLLTPAVAAAAGRFASGHGST